MRVLRWIAASGFRVTLSIVLLVFVYHVVNELRVMFGRPLNFEQRLELTALDVKFAARGSRPPLEWKVAIAALDERAIQEFGPPPWPRTIHARLVEKLTALGASSIAFDMTFDQASPATSRETAIRLADRAEAVGLGRTSQKLAADATRIGAVADRLERLSKSRLFKGALADGIQPLRAFAQDAAETKAAVDAFAVALEKEIHVENPDHALARAIKESARVVLGVICLSKNEAESIGVASADLARSLRIVRSSTIAELVTKGQDGLDTVHPGAAELFENGLYRRFFGLEAPWEGLASATPYFGTINAIPDDDGVYRRVPLVASIKGSGILLPTLALKAVEVATAPGSIQVIGTPDDPSPEAIQVGALRVDAELEAATTLDWYGHFSPEEMPIFSVSDILGGQLKDSDLRGRVVFVAATAAGTHDQRVTPLERAVPGVYIHATLAQNLLDGRHLTRPRHVIAIELVTFVLIGVFAGLVMARLDVLGQLVTAIGMSAGWLLLDQFLFFGRGTIVYTVLPLFQIFLTLLAVALWRFLVEQRERQQTRRAFGRYLSPAVMEQVLTDPEQYLKLGGKRYEATVLFSDIRGFTTISENLTPEELGLLLNRYMTPMTEIVFEFNGTLDKYIGDAVMAFWGAPVEQRNHALNACRAALKMQARVDTLNQELAGAKLPRIAIGIGISSGPMTIGNMGSDDHFAYTALGDRVNLGARLEGQTKEYGVDIIISEACWKLVKDQMTCRELGALRVIGKNETVRIFQLIGEAKDGEGRRPFLTAFQQGLDCYRARQWDEAIEYFTRARALSGLSGDKCSDHYIGWCMEYKVVSPPVDWDGVRIATSK